MSNIDQNTIHPSAMTPEQKAELDKLVEDETAGFDEADDLDEGDEGDAGKGSAETKDDAGNGDGKPDGDGGTAGKPDGAGEGDSAGAAGNEGEPGDGKANTVSRQQFDGVLAELRETRNELKTVKSQIAAKPAALPDRDFDSEDKALEDELAALDKRYDEDGDLSDDEYRRLTREIQSKQRGIDRERAKYEARSELLAQQQAQEQQAEKDAAALAQQQWDTDLGVWREALGDWLKNPARRALVDQTMNAMNADPELAALPNNEYLAKLNEYLGETFTDYPLNTAPAGGGNTAATERQVAAAKGAAKVTAAPPAINGGVGNRGTTTAEVDLEGMRLGDFKKLSKERQNELLGIPND